MSDERWSLTNEVPRVVRQQADVLLPTRQRTLFGGLDCLPGQEDLFPTDGEAEPMLALSVQQPWAWAIMAGIKPVENRTWRTKYRGELVIHAGLSVRRDQAGRDHIATLGHVVPETLSRGVLLGTVELVDCISSAEALTRFGAAWVDDNPDGWCWILRKPRLLIEPQKFTGKLNLFPVPLLENALFA